MEGHEKHELYENLTPTFRAFRSFRISELEQPTMNTPNPIEPTAPMPPANPFPWLGDGRMTPLPAAVTDPDPSTPPSDPAPPLLSASAGVFATLATLPPAAMISEAALAEALACTDRTIRAMARRGDIPPAIKVAGRACWFVGRLLQHLEAEADRKAKKQDRWLSKSRE